MRYTRSAYTPSCARYTTVTCCNDFSRAGSDELLQLALLKCSDKAKEASAQRQWVGWGGVGGEGWGEMGLVGEGSVSRWGASIMRPCCRGVGMAWGMAWGMALLVYGSAGAAARPGAPRDARPARIA